MNDTSSQFDLVIKKCQSLFEKKTKDYGTAWRILRLPSLTDQ
ncbi:MAG: nucleotide modification associated domain-containing protein, partial [Flavobacteriaceae bacterium]